MDSESVKPFEQAKTSLDASTEPEKPDRRSAQLTEIAALNCPQRRPPIFFCLF